MSRTRLARHGVAAALGAVPDLQVHPHPVTLDAVPAGGVAVVAATSTDYGAEWATRCIAPVTVEVYLAAGLPDTDPGALFDTLDDLADAAAAAVEAAGYAVTAARLDTLDAYPAYLLTLEVPA